MTRCICKTLKGDQCKKVAVEGKTMCNIHVKKCGSSVLPEKKVSNKKVTKKTVEKKVVSVKKAVKKVPIIKKVLINEKPNVESILDMFIKEFPNMAAYPQRNYNGDLEFNQLDDSEKKAIGIDRKLWWDYFPEDGPFFDERLNSKFYRIEPKIAPKKKNNKTGRICIYNQFGDYLGVEIFSDMLSERLKVFGIHHRIIGYEMEGFMINLFIGKSENDVLNKVKNFLNKTRMDEDWTKNNVSIGRLYHT